MSKHTPGPWQLWDVDKHVIIGANLLRVATAAGGKEFAAGNARLIAAAPELLEAAQVALEVLTSMTPHDIGAKDMLRQALAKAEGK